MQDTKHVHYAGHGVCKVMRTEERTIQGKLIKYNILSTNNCLTLMSPENDEKLRPLSSYKKIEKVLQWLDTLEVEVDNTTWNKRYRAYMELLKTGSIVKIAYVYKALVTLQFNKDLSFGERKMLDQAKELLESEMSIVLERNMKL